MASETNTLVAVDLFAGAGGLSTGLAQACEQAGLEPGQDVELHAINHWEDAIQTHERNHPWAEHYHARVEELYPPDVVDPGSVDILTGGPECTHFSNARGGKPVSDQRRASAWHVLDWVEKLQPRHVLIENVPEFRNWGPIEDDGTPSQDASIYERWIGLLEALGYSVIYDNQADAYGVVLNAADYGDPQDRKRLFILASREKLPTRPPKTHSADEDDGLPMRRPAADIIDWSDLGESIWTRDLENPRVRPLAENTMRRIAEGIRRHCTSRLEPLADAVETITPDRLRALREHVVPAEYAEAAAEALDHPFLVEAPSRGPVASSASLVKYYGTSTVRPIGAPVDTVTADGNHHALATHDTFCLRQQSGGVPFSTGSPMATVASGGAISLATVESRTLIQPRNGANGGWDSNIAYHPEARPFHTVIASDPRQGHLLTPSLIRYSHGGAALSTGSPMPTVATEKGGTFALSMPFLIEYYGNSDTTSVGEPLPTVPTRDRFALVVPEHYPWGLDIRYRMLEPRELKQAQGFPPDYEITGSSKKTQTGQIGNAVPVNLARNLVHHLLWDETPSLTQYGGGIQPADVEVPAYEEVASDD